MPVRLSTTTVSIIAWLPNSTNVALMTEFYQYMKNNGASESHTNNSLKTNMAFAQFLGPDVTFYDVKRKEQITAFLNPKIKSIKILTRNGLRHRMIISMISSIFLDGYIMIKRKELIQRKR
jgi:hypothetical protein